MVGYLLRPADRAEEDRIVTADARLPVVWKHLAVTLVVVPAREVEVVEFQLDAEAARGGFENAQAFGHHFAADAVAGDDGNAMGRHSLTPCLKNCRISPSKASGCSSAM